MSFPRSTEQRGASHTVMTSLRARSGVAACVLISVSLMLSGCAGFKLPFPRSKKAEEPASTASTTTSSTSSSGGTLSQTPTSAPPTATPDNGPAKPPEPVVAEKDEKGRSLFGFGRKKKAAPAAQASGTAAVAKPVDVPPQARAEFDRAVGLVRSGKDLEAQLEFTRIASAYPQFASPDVNLGILYRKAGNLEKSEAALQEAVNRNRDSAVSWNELGVTQRMRGDFKAAQDSYENAIRVDPDFAAAYRNLGVLLDLYVGDPEGALDNFERYKELTQEEKPVNGWIAELRQRTGKPPIRNKPVAPPSESAPAEGSNDNGAASPGSPAEAPPADGAAGDSATGPAASPSPGAAPAEPKRG